MRIPFTRKAVCALAFSTAVSIINTGCGSSAALTFTGLNQIPSTSGIVAASNSSSIRRSFVDYGGQFGRLLVEGTAPLYTDLGASGTAVDTYFFNGLVSSINTNWNSWTLSQKQAAANQFWGTTDGGPGGNLACQMAQSAGEAIARTMEAGASACYMKNIPQAASVTVTGASRDTLFNQAAADFNVQVNISGGGEDHNVDKVLIKVFGTNTVGNDVYKVQLTMCNSGSVTGLETYTINKATGAFTNTSLHSDNGNGSSTMEAFLTNSSDGSVVFDTNQPRTLNGAYSYDNDGFSGEYLGKILIEGSVLTAWRKNSWDDGSNTGTDKNYSKSSISGTGATTLRFLEGANKGLSSNSSASSSWPYSGSFSFRNTFYASASNDYTAAIDAEDLSTDEFFQREVEENDYDNASCDVSATATVEMDFGQEDVMAIAEECNGEREAFQNYNMCYGDGISQAMQHIWDLY